MHEHRSVRVRPTSPRRWWLPLALLTALALAAGQTGCGTVMYPYRRGPHSGVPDPDVVAMDIFWLCMGLWPGILAFWVDARTGALYLPRGTRRAASRSRSTRRPSRLRPMPRPPAPALPPPPPDVASAPVPVHAGAGGGPLSGGGPR